MQKIAIILILTNLFIVTNYIKALEQSDKSIIYVCYSGSGNYTTIQEGIDAANSGDIVYVYNGTYFENIVIDTSITLLGENKTNTIIDGRLTGNVIKVNANNVTIKGFIIQHSGIVFPNAGINLSSNYNLIEDNQIMNNFYGMTMYLSSRNIIKGNTIQENDHCGIYMSKSSHNNIINNIIKIHNYNGIGIYDSSDKNIIQDNNFYNNDYCGVNIRKSSNISIIGNNFTENHIGIHLPHSNHNIHNNIFSNNNIDIDKELSLLNFESIIIFIFVIIVVIVGILFLIKTRKRRN